MKKLLLIEDDPFLIKLYAEIFAEANYKVDQSLNGEEGLKKANSLKPDIILLDIMLPNMNGLEVLEKLKSNADTKEIPVVVITNLASSKDQDKATSLGAVKYLIKTQYDPDQIVDIIKEIVSP